MRHSLAPLGANAHSLHKAPKQPIIYWLTYTRVYLEVLVLVRILNLYTFLNFVNTSDNASLLSQLLVLLRTTFGKMHSKGLSSVMVLV